VVESRNRWWEERLTFWVLFQWPNLWLFNRLQYLQWQLRQAEWPNNKPDYPHRVRVKVVGNRRRWTSRSFSCTGLRIPWFFDWAELQHRTGANFCPVELAKGNIFAGTAALNRVARIRVLSNNLITPNTKCLSWTTGARAPFGNHHRVPCSQQCRERLKLFARYLSTLERWRFCPRLRFAESAFLACWLIRYYEYRPQIVKPGCGFLRIDIIDFGCSQLTKLL